MFSTDNLFGLMRTRAESFPSKPAVLAPGREQLTYSELFLFVERTVRRLASFGIGCDDRVTIVLPNGPEAATCCLAVAAGAIAAPLNPSFTAAEFEFYLQDLKPKAVIVESSRHSPVLEVARRMGLRVLHLSALQSDPAGLFDLESEGEIGQSGQGTFGKPENVALLLHTSGSTSRPKSVPLTHANLCISAANIVESLDLQGEDKCLNIMPLFHIHGLVGAVLSSLTAGGTVVCTQGLNVLKFFDWLDEFRPTWFTAVPTMHQSILHRIVHGNRRNLDHSLRFIRSCSSALSPKLMGEMENAFQVPVIEAYGMTEAAHQIAVNRLPPSERKPGSVGIAAGCEIAVVDDRGKPVASGEMGDVIIRGPNVIKAYLGDPDVNAKAFTGDWLYTGDLGRLDADGYLFLMGRSKEIINRGGEKITPREIDEALLEHPAVAQAIAFAMPDSHLGEEVGAAIVLRESWLPTEGLDLELKSLVAGKLTDFKVPRKIVFTAEIPKGPTGKLQRIGLAEKLHALEVPKPRVVESHAAPSSMEVRLIAIWREILGMENPGLHEDFFDAGGDSILGSQLASRLQAEFGVDFPHFQLFSLRTIAKIASWIELLPKRGTSLRKPLRPERLPMSYGQERLWFVDRLEGGASTEYNVPVALRLKGELDRDLLERALNT
ncbi:MAG TPA: AMP-binding protein, partial [Candidatus Angelobacter sp.]|nr:AMP-binding protein [Candidatus Angelobacter sp.]